MQFFALLKVSSPILRDVRFSYDSDKILSRSLTSTNFHTYYEGSEMVVAGKLPELALVENLAAFAPPPAASSLVDEIKYEIVATQDKGGKYSVSGVYNASAVSRIMNSRDGNKGNYTVDFGL